MKLEAALALGAASAAFALPKLSNDISLPESSLKWLEKVLPAGKKERFLVELSPGETRWVTEDEKWALRRDGKNFIDVTDYQNTPQLLSSRPPLAGNVQFPDKPAHSDAIKPLLKHLSEEPMRQDLTKFSSFHTRYYKSKYGAQSSKWLQGRVHDALSEAKAAAKVLEFPHPWGQSSVIARIPGQTNTTVVIGAHQDSINLWLPDILPAPGADDDGSGTVTILEALRALLRDEDIRNGKARNTLEFHWYSAEEGGLLGSQAIFAKYAQSGQDVRAMLQQDMTGFVKKTLAAGQPESVGVITDFVDPGLTTFIEKVITEYCDIPFVRTRCGYACSDHASASKNGYPSAFVIEADFSYTSDRIHSGGDTIDTLSFSHMLQHAKLTLGLAYELAYAELPVKGTEEKKYEL